MNRSMLFAAALVAGAAVTTVSAQPLSPEAKRALDARDWKALSTTLSPLGDKATGDSGYWQAIAKQRTGDLKGASKTLMRLWNADQKDKSLALAVLEYADLGHVQNIQFSELPLAHIDHEVCGAYILSRARLMEYALRQGTASWRTSAGYLAGGMLDAYERYLELAPMRDPEVTRWVGFAARLRSDGRALALIEEARAVLGPSWDLELDRAVALLQRGDEAAALAAYTKALELAPAVATTPTGGQSRRVDCVLGWAQALHDTGRYREAAQAFREAIAMQGSVSGARHRLGLALYAAGDTTAALAAFMDSQRVEDNAETVMYIGRCWYDLAEFGPARVLLAEARAKYKAAEAREPIDLVYYHGRACWGDGAREEAIKHLETAFGADVHSLARAKWLFEAYLAMEDPYGAIDVARRYGSQRARNHNAIREEAIAEVLKRFPTPLLSDRAKGRPMPHTSLAQVTRAQMAYTSMNFREALEHMRVAGMLFPMRANSMAAWTLLQTGDVAGAEKLAASAVQLAGSNAAVADEARLCQGVALLMQGQADKAIGVLNAITDKKIAVRRDVPLLYATLAAGKKPEAKLLTAYTTLGVVEPADQRLIATEVFVILPGSPLLDVEPKLCPGDTIRIQKDEVSGERVVTAAKGPALRGKVVLSVVRSAEFEVTADFTEWAKKLPPAPPGPESKSGEKKP